MAMVSTDIFVEEIDTVVETEGDKIRRYAEFLAVYASYMLGCGATCIRIEKNLRRMANAVGLQVDMIILSHHVTVICTDNRSGIKKQSIRRLHPTGISFEINTRLSELSWKIAEKKVSFEEAGSIFYRIVNRKPMTNDRVLLLVVLANASFCHLFGGDWGSMLIVGVATFIGYLAKVLMLSRGWDDKIVWLICAFISALCAAGMNYIPDITVTPNWSIAASVLYLIPGIPYINSISDCIDGHYLCSIGRLIHALALTICIALGLTAGLLIANIKPMIG